jgi:amino acid transporter
MSQTTGSHSAEPHDVDSVEQFGYKQELKRSLSFWDLLVFGMLFMVPTAPMGVYGFVSESAFGMVPLVYLVGGVGMIFTALAYQKLSAAFPIAGSVYAYVQRGINPHVGFIGGWLILLDYIMIPSLLYAFVGTWLNSILPSVPVWVFVLAILAFITVLNILGIKITATANWFIFGFQIIILIAFIVAALIFIVAPGGPGFTIAPLWQPGKIDAGFIGVAASTAVLSFLGFDGIATLAEEVPNPRKTVGKAIVVCLILIASIFILFTYLAQAAVPNPTGTISDWDPNIGFFQVAGVIGGAWLFQATLWSQIIGAGVGNTITAMASVSRLLYSMGRDRMLPGFFATVHKKYETPYLSILFMAVFSALAAVLIPLDQLVRLVNFGALTAFMLLNYTVFHYYFIKLGRRSGAAIVSYIIFPILGIGILGYVWWGFDLTTKIVGISWLVLGLIWGAVKSRGYREVPEAFRNLDVA